MGICGLNSFLAANPQLSKESKLHDQKLVIDGKNLTFHLFMAICDSPRFNDWRCDVYGGNMVGYAEAVRSFFEKINQCKIEPFVVISGRRNIDDESTRIKVQNQFNTAQSIQENAQDDYIVVPSSIKTVFTSVLKELGIKLYVANNYTATIRDMANKHDCPVLTNDGVFFIYPLKKGLILLNSFDYEKLGRTVDGDGYCFSDCLIYQQDKLLDFFPRLNLSFLPLLGVSLTYSKSNNFKRVSQALNYIRYKGGLYTPTDPHRRIVNLLTYFEGKTLRAILDFFLGRFDQREQSGAWVRIQDSMINHWSVNEDDLAAKIRRFYQPDAAAYLVKQFTSGDINTILYDMIAGQIHFNYPEIDDHNQESSFHIMIRPLSVALALLKKRNFGDDAILVLFDNPYCEHKIGPIDNLEGYGSLENITISQTIRLPLEERKNIISSTFQFDDKIYDQMTLLMKDRFKDDTYMYQATICMLLLRHIHLEALSKNVDNHVLPEFVRSVLVTILFYSSENGNIDCPEGEKFGKLSGLSVKNSSPHLKPMPGNYREIMHLITQLQTAFKGFFLLNILLDCPFEQPKLELFFNGVLIYRVTQELLSYGTDNHTALIDFGFEKDSADVESLVLA